MIVVRPYCSGPDWRPYSGHCGACGSILAGRSKWFCGKQCRAAYAANHWWGWARLAAIRRDGGCAREGCDERGWLEVNHIEPRRGAGYGNGCHHHQAGLETLCHQHHLAATAEQRRVALRERTGRAEQGVML